MRVIMVMVMTITMTMKMIMLIIMIVNMRTWIITLITITMEQNVTKDDLNRLPPAAT